MFDVTSGNAMIQSMDVSLSLASKRMSLIASNLANLDSALDGQNSPATLSSTHPMPLQGTTSTALPPTTDALKPNSERNDGNDVSLDRENMLLSRTQTDYQTASTLMQVELRKLYSMIREASAH